MTRPAFLERGRAVGLLTGLGAFVLGFAVAGVLVTLGAGGRPPYLVAITVGLLGVGLTGVALGRGTVPMPRAPIWSRETLTLIARSAQVPPTPTMVALYVLAAVGVLGNIVIPLSGTR